MTRAAIGFGDRLTGRMAGAGPGDAARRMRVIAISPERDSGERDARSAAPASA